MIYFFVFLLMSNQCITMEMEAFPIPRCSTQIQHFSKSTLRGYLHHFKNEKLDGHQYFSAILKDEYNLPQHRKRPKIYMLNLWFVDEVFNLEKKRRKKDCLRVYNLGALLRDITLIPDEIRARISFPPDPDPTSVFIPEPPFLTPIKGLVPPLEDEEEIAEENSEKSPKRVSSLRSLFRWKSLFNLEFNTKEYI